MSEKEIIRDCLLCKKPGEILATNMRDTLLESTNPNERWIISFCKDCCLFWTGNRPKEASMEQYYRSYPSHESSSKFLPSLYLKYPIVKYLPLLGEKAQAQTMFLSPKYQRGLPELLDIGTGSGSLLRIMSDKGWSTIGTDPYGTWSTTLPIVHTLRLKWAEFESDRFDVITLSHSLEHLYDPIGELRECRRLLKPGGSLIILTPNTASLGHQKFLWNWRGLEVPRHLYLFNQISGALLLEKARLKTKTNKTICRLAPNFYWASKLITRNGIYKREDLTKTLVLKGLVFWAWESLRNTRDQTLGEELLLIATKD